jgi:hypothetical protein
MCESEVGRQSSWKRTAHMSRKPVKNGDDALRKARGVANLAPRYLAVTISLPHGVDHFEVPIWYFLKILSSRLSTST